MKLRITFYIIVAASFMLFAASGCKSKKTTAAQLEEKTHTQVIDDVLNNGVKYTTISTRGSIDFNGRKGPAQYKIIKDSVIQISVLVPILRTELIRITITPDSINIIDRYKKQYLAEDINEMKSAVQFNYSNMEALFTNRLFISGSNAVTAGDYKKLKVASTGEVYQIQYADKNKFLYNFAVDATDHIVSTLISLQKNDMTMQWNYSNFVNDNGSVYPQKIEANVDAMGNSMAIVVEYSKLEIDKEVVINKSKPDNYKIVGFSEFIKSYMKSK